MEQSRTVLPTISGVAYPTSTKVVCQQSRSLWQRHWCRSLISPISKKLLSAIRFLAQRGGVRSTAGLYWRSICGGSLSLVALWCSTPILRSDYASVLVLYWHKEEVPTIQKACDGDFRDEEGTDEHGFFPRCLSERSFVPLVWSSSVGPSPRQDHCSVSNCSV